MPFKPKASSVYPISQATFLAIASASIFAFVVISPPTRTKFVVAKVSQATWLSGSCLKHSSRIASEIWSQTLSGCPSPTDSEVNKY